MAKLSGMPQSGYRREAACNTALVKVLPRKKYLNGYFQYIPPAYQTDSHKKAVIKSLVAYYIARPLGVMTNNVTQPKKTAPTTPFIGKYSSTFDTACQALRLFCAFSVAKGAVF